MPETDVVQMHSEYGRDAHPAVNIKVTTYPESVTLPLELGSASDGPGLPFEVAYTAPEFTHEWVERNLSESAREMWWQTACRDGFEMAKDLARETFGGVEVYSEGRSEGWLVVHGLSDVEDWSPGELATWVEFERQVKEIVADVPRNYLWLINANVFELEQDGP